MSILGGLQEYAGKWAVKASEKLSAEDVASVSNAVVTDSKFGKSVCFHMANGGQRFIPLATDSKLEIGQEFPVANATVLTLSKDGAADIIRVIEG